MHRVDDHAIEVASRAVMFAMLEQAPRGGTPPATTHQRRSLGELERSVRISRSTLSCLLHAKVYGAYPSGATFSDACRTRMRSVSPVTRVVALKRQTL
jgi:hypothetical protein